MGKRGGARPGAGRKPGSRNKVTAEVQDLARVHAPAVIRELARLALKAESETARVAAANTILDRAYGKARQEVEHSGQVGIEHWVLSSLGITVEGPALIDGPSAEPDED